MRDQHASVNAMLVPILQYLLPACSAGFTTCENQYCDKGRSNSMYMHGTCMCMYIHVHVHVQFLYTFKTYMYGTGPSSFKLCISVVMMQRGSDPSCLTCISSVRADPPLPDQV